MTQHEGMSSEKHTPVRPPRVLSPEEREIAAYNQEFEGLRQQIDSVGGNEREHRRGYDNDRAAVRANLKRIEHLLAKPGGNQLQQWAMGSSWGDRWLVRAIFKPAPLSARLERQLEVTRGSVASLKERAERLREVRAGLRPIFETLIRLYEKAKAAEAKYSQPLDGATTSALLGAIEGLEQGAEVNLREMAQSQSQGYDRTTARVFFEGSSRQIADNMRAQLIQHDRIQALLLQVEEFIPSLEGQVTLAGARALSLVPALETQESLETTREAVEALNRVLNDALESLAAQVEGNPGEQRNADDRMHQDTQRTVDELRRRIQGGRTAGT